MKKKKWKTPSLLVLVRGKQAEVVLNACKSASGSGPAAAFSQCHGGLPEDCVTFFCAEWVAS